MQWGLHFYSGTNQMEYDGDELSPVFVRIE